MPHAPAVNGNVQTLATHSIGTSTFIPFSLRSNPRSPQLKSMQMNDRVYHELVAMRVAGETILEAAVAESKYTQQRNRPTASSVLS